MSWNNLKSDHIHDIKCKSLSVSGVPVNGSEKIIKSFQYDGPHLSPHLITNGLKMVKTGDVVTLTFDGGLTSDFNTASPIYASNTDNSSDVIPSEFAPNTSLYMITTGTNANNDVQVEVYINTAGHVRINNLEAGNAPNFTGANYGVNAFTISYVL